jgi:hypothetical protein
VSVLHERGPFSSTGLPTSPSVRLSPRENRLAFVKTGRVLGWPISLSQAEAGSRITLRKRERRAMYQAPAATASLTKNDSASTALYAVVFSLLLRIFSSSSHPTAHVRNLMKEISVYIYSTKRSHIYPVGP